MADEIRIQYKFTRKLNQVPNDQREFTDCLYLTEAEYAAMNQQAIDALIKERVDNHITVIGTPQQVYEPVEMTKEQIEEEIEKKEWFKLSLQAEIAAIDSAKATLTAAKVALDKAEPLEEEIKP